ncbi:hypothetical protein LTR56_002794 [Elasticomyces elasticus]|nr:hypothetical protein LTR56_002794 [Elasticomyces elasticus]KAK3666749.1 hypothetical protein LTR22_002336 [Elasticomyces elasticus]KAK4920408.1 hypothetical protein LTR49_012000 [Elasticomyces elasticus]KAK5759304.1 hypothetical protein LTS12_010627 [Elasticomyces elasticus]
MASEIPFVRGRPSISIIERTLGLRRARGVGSEKRRLQFKVMRDLDAALVQAVEQYAILPCDEILTSNNIKAAAYSIFETIGPHVWPDNLSDPTNDRFVWLAKASYDNLEGYYPRNLFYSRIEDRTQLRHSFYHLVVAKCYGYAKHHPDFARQRRSYDRPSAYTPSRTSGSRASPSSVSSAAERLAKSKESTEHGAGVIRAYTADLTGIKVHATSVDAGLLRMPVAVVRNHHDVSSAKTERFPPTSECTIPHNDRQVSVVYSQIERHTATVQPLVTLHDHEQSHRALELEILRGYEVFQDFSRRGIVFTQDQLTVLMHVMATCPAARQSEPICHSELLKVTNGQKMVSLIQADTLPPTRASRPESYDGTHATMDIPYIFEHPEDATSMDFSDSSAQSVGSSRYAAPRAHAPASSTVPVPSTGNPRTVDLQPSSVCTGNSAYQTGIPQQLNEQAIEDQDNTGSSSHEAFVCQAILARPEVPLSTSLRQDSQSVTTPDVAFTSKMSWNSDTSDWKDTSSHDVDPTGSNEDYVVVRTASVHRRSPEHSEPTDAPGNDDSTLYSPRQTLCGSSMKAKEYHTQIRSRSRGTDGCISEVSDSESPITARRKPEHEGVKRRRTFSVPEGASDSRDCKRLLTTHGIGINWSRAGDVYEDQDQEMGIEFDKDDIDHGPNGHQTSSSSGIDPCQPPTGDLRAVAQLSPTPWISDMQAPPFPLARDDRRILESVNVEIDWAMSGKLPGDIYLGVCDSPASFFGQIDRQNTSGRYFHTVKVEDVNHQGGPKTVNTRIHRTGSGALGPFRAMMRRVMHEDATVNAKYRVTVEWHYAQIMTMLGTELKF